MVVNLRFYILRLRCCSLVELLHRIRQSAASAHLRWLIRRESRLIKTPAIERRDISNLRMPELIPENSHEAYRLFSLDGPDVLDPSAAIDIRMRWESARLQRATAAIVYTQRFPNASDCASTKQAAGDLILHWIETNPFMYGEHYVSAMECALRVPVFFYALKRLDNLSHGQRCHILETIYRHARLIFIRLSLYSSLGNHTIAEAVGLVFAGAVFKTTTRGRKWLNTGIGLLSSELPHQISADGSPAEQSLGYHRFVLDLYWLAVDFIQKNRLGEVDSWSPRLSLGESFLNAFVDEDGRIASIGDSDDGAAVAPGIKPLRHAGQMAVPGLTVFPHGGYSVNRRERLLFTFDHGPLGMSPLFNHGHADALSITLAIGGKPLLVDSGTFRYNGVPKWRSYFKGTRAHNTVTIDGQDQAVQETGFIWSHPYAAEATGFVDEANHLFLTAVHDGYTRLNAPVRHRRSVLFFDRTNFLIRDRFSGGGLHDFQLNFHLHPDAVVSKKDQWWVAENTPGRLFIRLIEGELQWVQGRDNPIIGWYSSRYGMKMPTGVLTAATTGEPNAVTFTTAVYSRSPFDDNDIEAKAGEREGTLKNS